MVTTGAGGSSFEALPAVRVLFVCSLCCFHFFFFYKCILDIVGVFSCSVFCQFFPFFIWLSRCQTLSLSLSLPRSLPPSSRFLHLFACVICCMLLACLGELFAADTLSCRRLQASHFLTCVALWLAFPLVQVSPPTRASSHRCCLLEAGQIRSHQSKPTKGNLVSGPPHGGFPLSFLCRPKRHPPYLIVKTMLVAKVVACQKQGSPQLCACHTEVWLLL